MSTTTRTLTGVVNIVTGTVLGFGVAFLAIGSISLLISFVVPKLGVGVTGEFISMIVLSLTGFLAITNRITTAPRGDKLHYVGALLSYVGTLTFIGATYTGIL